ncbi:MAG: pyridoxal-phosphate dependent enzyme [Deltaproteobacteria bacterium]|nr:pyridoxal-phosphate dependent enzyme [Deltaproteobacteria bacterium]
MLYKDVLRFIATQPRLQLETWPTPMMPMDGLRRALAAEGPCPKLWVKREDMTSYGLGGDKIRRLEFAFAKVREAGADVVIISGGIHSNTILQVSAVCARLGLECEVFVTRAKSVTPEDENDAVNVMVCLLHGARVHLMGTLEIPEQVTSDRADELRAEGRRPFLIEPGGTSPYSTFGAILCLEELLEQIREKGFTPTAIVAPTGWCGNAAGFLIGLTLLAASGGPSIPLYVFDTFGKDAAVPARKRIMNIVTECWKLLGLSGKCDDSLLYLSTDFAGQGVSHPDARAVEAIRFLGCKEGLLLDPSYTGKCMAGLLHMIRNKVFTQKDNVVYLHPGGMPAMFAMRRIL